ncbi:MAG: 16S rRNA (cytidine(1402)-2'-O)-methyltransferase [Chloroflexota bacterium]
MSAPTEAVRGRLYVVATPIGNLGDVTLRALEVLAAVPLIAAEDTRHSRRLLDRHGLTTRMVSFHAGSGPARREQLLDHLRAGSDLAMITDAGTPGVSDPGDDLVRAWAAEDGVVVPIPGASAVLAAVAASGIAGPRWAFEGFLPRSGRDRRERLARIGADDRATVLFEAPGRVAATLADLAAACADGRPGAACRELTKIHETVERGSLGELAARARDGAIPPRGEFVLIVGLAARSLNAASDAGQETDERLRIARAEVDRLIATGAGRAEAARTVAAATGLPRRALYSPAT